jgi:hypothetical protein
VEKTAERLLTGVRQTAELAMTASVSC